MATIVDKMTAEELGIRIKERRKTLRMTQGDLARLACCSKPSVFAVEKGKPTLRLNILLTILQVLGLKIQLEDDRLQARTADEIE